MTLAYTGCQLSEALALTVDQVDIGAGLLVFESLKKHRPGVYRLSQRAGPLPLLDTLEVVPGVRELQTQAGRGRCVRL